MPNRDWLVAVSHDNITSKGSTYLYGPFKSIEEANVWVEQEKYSFFGRIINIIPNEVTPITID